MTDDWTEAVEVVEREHDIALRFVDGVVGSSFTIRGWGLTAWAALLGVAINKDQAMFALLAAIVVLAFAVVDAYHSWLYGQALSYVRTVERIIQLRYKVAMRPHERTYQTDLAVELRTFKPGLISNLPRFRVRDLLRARPGLFFQVFYPSVVVVALLVMLITWRSEDGTGKETWTPTANVRCLEQPAWRYEASVAERAEARQGSWRASTC
jgi:hypothetical protein